MEINEQVGMTPEIIQKVKFSLFALFVISQILGIYFYFIV